MQKEKQVKAVVHDLVDRLAIAQVTLAAIDGIADPFIPRGSYEMLDISGLAVRCQKLTASDLPGFSYVRLVVDCRALDDDIRATDAYKRQHERLLQHVRALYGRQD